MLSASVVCAIAVALALGGRQHNVAHWVGLAFAVAASSNFPCLLLTLYWRRTTTAGVVAGMVAGTLCAVALILVSPNLSYPQRDRAQAQKVIDGAPQREAFAAGLSASAKTVERERGAAEAKALAADLEHARGVLDSSAGQATSWLGLEAPWFELMNPGVVSIPVGFIAAILVSLLGRRRGSSGDWDAFRLRRLTGIR